MKKDIFRGKDAIDEELYNCLDASFLANPGLTHCIDYVFNNATRNYFISSNRLDINFPVKMNSEVSEDGKIITVECEPRNNSDLWGVNGSRMIRKGIVSVNPNGSIKVSEITATSFKSSEYEQAKLFMSLEGEPEGEVVYVCERTSFLVDSNGNKIAKSYNIDSYSKDYQDDEELRKVVNGSYDDQLQAIEPVNVSLDAPEKQYIAK